MIYLVKHASLLRQKGLIPLDIGPDTYHGSSTSYCLRPVPAGTNPIKLFTAVIYAFSYYARVLVPDKSGAPE
jgi:hypothetical protein